MEGAHAALQDAVRRCQVISLSFVDDAFKCLISSLIFDSPLAHERKIILSTNIAESSLTIPDVEYVVDFCLTKLLKADAETQYVRLHLEWADKQSLKQRMVSLDLTFFCMLK